MRGSKKQPKQTTGKNRGKKTMGRILKIPHILPNQEFKKDGKHKPKKK